MMLVCDWALSQAEENRWMENQKRSISLEAEHHSLAVVFQCTLELAPTCFLFCFQALQSEAISQLFVTWALLCAL